MKKFTPIILFLLGLMICAILGYAVWDSGYLQTAENKNSEEQVASDTSEQDITAADKAAADKAAEEKAAADKAAADKAAEEKAAADKAAADKAAADKAAEEKAAADKAAADKAAEEKTAEEKAAADKTAEEKAAEEKAAADKAAEEKAAADKAAADKAAAEEREKIQNAMGFDILRIESTGGTVVAGRALADSEVELIDSLDQNRVLTQTTTSAAGEFALVLDKPLSEGKHEIYIRALDASGNKFISNELALVEVFDANLNKIPVVILSKSGTATRMLQGEETQVTQENSAGESEQAQESSPEQDATEEAEAEPDPVNAVFIKAADVEGGKLIIAGTGPANGVLNMYLDDQLLGQAQIEQNNSFIYEKTFILEAGRHSIRADRVDAATSKVLGRAEVSLIHEPELAAVEETATEEPVSEEATTEETASSEESASDDDTQAQSSSSDQDSSSDQSQTTEQASNEGENTDQATGEIRTGSTVIIRRGDSLWRVSRKNYGEGVKFTVIFEANKDQIRDPDLIYPGQVFDIPELK